MVLQEDDWPLLITFCYLEKGMELETACKCLAGISIWCVNQMLRSLSQNQFERMAIYYESFLIANLMKKYSALKQINFKEILFIK